MKKWILLFLPAFCLGVYLGCLLAKRTLERREKNHPACAVLYHRKTKPLSELFSFCEKESPVRPYFHLVRNGTHWDALSSFCLPPRKMDEFLTEVKQSSPDLIPFRGPDSAPFLTRYEFLPGGLFSLLRPDEWYRTGRFALGIHRPGNRVFLRWNIPDAPQASAEGKSTQGSGQTIATAKKTEQPAASAVPETRSRWLPLSILLVCIAVGFLLLLILKRREA